MPVSLPLEFFLWSCFALSLVAFVPLGYGTYRIVEDEEDGWPQLSSFVVGLLVVMALMTCSLLLLGHSTSALWVWRGFNAIISILSSLFCVRTLQLKGHNPSPHLGGVSLLFAATFVAIFFFVCSTVVRTVPHEGTCSSVALSAEPAAGFLTQLNFWHAALYVILALGSVICGLLFIFIATSRTDGPLSFERSGGGLGTGSGGWEISNSLTYLIATIAVSALLMALIFHNDTIDQERDKRQADASQKASTPMNVTTTSTLAAPKQDTGRIAPAAARPPGAEFNGH